jgi:hypothetical protein
MNKIEKQATYGTQDEEKQSKKHHYIQTNTNNLNKT